MEHLKLSYLIFASILLASCINDNEVKIVWDTWGIPHIYAKSEQQLVYGLAWSEMQNHGNQILKFYGISKGRAAEYWGATYLDSDREVWTLGLPQLAKQQYDALSSEERLGVDAFALGINNFAKKHGELLNDDLEVVLPVSGLDVVQHTLRAVHLPFPGRVNSIIQAYTDTTASSITKTKPNVAAASNAWAIGPGKSVSGGTLLLSNTHYPWPNLPSYDHLVWHEAHLVGSEFDVYGVGLIGVPGLVMGFNDIKAWTVTAAAASTDTLDTYELTKLNDGYLFDGEKRTFKQETIILRVKQADGNLNEVPLLVKRSLHGPIIFENSVHALALKMAIPDKVAGSQLWDMAKSNTPEEFLTALEPQSLSAMNILYADGAGNILYSLAGAYPDRESFSYDSSIVLPGVSSNNLWHSLLPLSRMPKVINPDTGYLQNANEPPWSSTLPSQLDPADFPQDIASARISLRAASSLKILNARDKFSLENMIHDKFSTHSELAERVLDDLIAIATTSSDPQVQQATQILADWDRNYDSDSVGATVFAYWCMEFSPGILQGAPFPETLYAQPYDPLEPLSTPRGLINPMASLQALKNASQKLVNQFGGFGTPWGELLRFRLAQHDLPAYGTSGSLGVFSVSYGYPAEGGKLVTRFGETWVFAIDFADPDNAMAVTSYSNASRQGSPHAGDQLPLYAQKQLRPIWRTVEDIESHKEFSETLNPYH